LELKLKHFLGECGLGKPPQVMHVVLIGSVISVAL